MYFQVHQPHRLREYRLFDIGTGVSYFDDTQNRAILHKVCEKCYIPTNRVMLDLIHRFNGRFRIAFSLSGVLVEQLEREAPHVLRSFQELVSTGCVELLGETYYHSLAALADHREFADQVRSHTEAMQHWFGFTPRVFRNTELIYYDDLAPAIAGLGFRACVVEGVERVLGWHSPNYVYEAAPWPGLKLLARNYALSDDVGYRFSARNWIGWPLTAPKYADWLRDSGGECVNLFMDYETFGEHQWADTGIFDFLYHLPEEVERRGMGFVTPSQLADRWPHDRLSFPGATSWADQERDVSAWLGSRLQAAAHRHVCGLRDDVLTTGNLDLIHTWRRLTTSDHFYHMCAKGLNDGEVHTYFSPYRSPYDAYVRFMNVMEDLKQAIDGASHAPRREAREMARV